MIDPSNQHFIQEMVAAITKLNPDARPMIPDASGVQRLNLNDPTIIASLRQAFVTYDALLEKHGLTGDRAKLRRSFKYEYGLTPDEPKPLG
jgi:hypothetical protein